MKRQPDSQDDIDEQLESEELTAEEEDLMQHMHESIFGDDSE